LFGSCVVRVDGADCVEVKGAKHRALFALLATAPLGRRTRSYLQRTLWGSSCYDGGRQNLRRALSDLRSLLGADFDRFIKCTNSDVELDMSLVNFLGAPGVGAFMEGIGIRDRGFEEWVASVRADESQIAALYRTTPRTELGRPLPRITALPFQRIMGGDDLRVLGDWLAEEVCRSLSRSNLLSVISHLSSRALATRTTDTLDVRRELDVDYFVTGSIRDMGGRIVVDMDFVDARDGNIMWTRQIAGPQTSFWDNISTGLDGVVRAVGRSIADEAIAYVNDRPVPELDDHHLVIGGVSLMHRPTFRDFAKSRTLLEEAVSRAPMVAETHAWLAKWYVLSVFNGWTTDRNGDTQKALDASSRALDINPDSSFSLVIDGFAHNNLMQRMDVASQRYDTAIDINPNESLSWLLRGALLAFQDEGADAIAAAEQARGLSPIDPFGYYYDSLSSTAYLAAENYDRALELADRSLAFNDRHLSTLRAKITALHFLGRGEEARVAGIELLRRAPAFSLDAYKSAHPVAKAALGQKVIAALEAAGIS
jgi:TolB-like protein/tetratricopeptide (TPR) repeat protein